MIDITAPISERLPIWPSSSGWSLDQQRWEVEGELITNTTLTSDLHVGTHVEAPAHFLESGRTLEELGLSPLVGPAYVAHIPEVPTIDYSALQQADIPDDVQRLLIRTDNADWWINSEFRTDFVGFDESASQWCVEHRLTLVGIDYLSIQSYSASPETHRILMRSGLTILEGLNLLDAQSGPCMLVCLPMRLVAVEAAPARAILLPFGHHDD